MLLYGEVVLAGRTSSISTVFRAARWRYRRRVPEHATHSPEPAGLDIGWNLSILFRSYLRQANAAFADLPGGPRAYQLLVSIERDTPTSQLALARRLGIDRTVMTYLIDDMVEADLVERQTDPRDRRARTIVATARGRRLLPDLDRRLAAIEAELLAALTPAEADRLRHLLRKAAADHAAADPSGDPRDLTRELQPTPTRTRREVKHRPR
jgi:MarR family transcriptional regulator for hemolysin